MPSYVTVDFIATFLGHVADVSVLRGMFVGLSSGAVFTTKHYGVISDTGGMSYYWDATDQAVDDGVLHIANSHYAVGRFRPVKPSDGSMNAQACGPALVDVGSITRSFDPTGVRAMGSELKRVTALLRNAGWQWLVFGKDYAGNGTYATSGSEEIGQSALPWVPFGLKGAEGASFVSSGDPNPSAFGIQVIAETPIATGGYGPRYWTQTIAGGERIFPGVADITGLSVGDTMFVRISSNTSDFSGQPFCWFFGVIKSITPGSGTTGTVETWECVPEPAPASSPGNPARLVNKHDMMKVTGFQDLTSVVGIIMNKNTPQLSGYRNLTIDCTWPYAPYSCINGEYGIGLLIPNIVVGECHGVGFTVGDLITLAQQYDTHIMNMIVYDMSPRGGQTMHVLTEEGLCRGTRVDFADITVNTSEAGGLAQFCGQTPFQDDIITVGHLVIRGWGSLAIGEAVKINCLDYKGQIPAGNGIDPGNCDSLIWQGKLYRKQIHGDYSMPVAVGTTTTINLPNHGLTTGLRLKMGSMTGVTDVLVSGDGFSVINASVLGEINGTNWTDIYTAVLTLIFRPNWIGYNSMSVKIITDGTSPASNWIAIRHSCYEIDQSNATTTQTDTSVPPTIVTAGAPASNASYISQECFDSTNAAWYKAVQVGTGATDWKKLTP